MTAMAAGPAVEARRTCAPSRTGVAPAATKASSSWGEIPPSGPTTSRTSPESGSGAVASGVVASSCSTKVVAPAQRRVVSLLATIQSLLAIAAWTDLARRPADTVNGSKKKWAAIIFVNFFGPLTYFRRGRIQSK